MRLRFSIAGLMTAVLLLAVGFAGLRTASALWASAVFTLTVTLLAAAILGAVACRGRSRIAWLGFGVFGWTYLLATFWLWPAPNGVTAPPLLTKALLDYFQPSSKTAAVMWIDTAPPGEMSTEPPHSPGECEWPTGFTIGESATRSRRSSSASWAPCWAPFSPPEARWPEGNARSGRTTPAHDQPTTRELSGNIISYFIYNDGINLLRNVGSWALIAPTLRRRDVR